MTAKLLRKSGISFFLGAGASMDMGFPSGAELKNRISRDLRHPQETELGRVILRTLPRERGKLRAFGDDLSASEETSIDAFLHRRQEHLTSGRLAVWLCILEAERTARTKDITGHWMYRFLDSFLDGVQCPGDLDRRYPGSSRLEFLHGLVINTLNYDRLAEHTLVTWIQTRIPELDLAAGNYAASLNPGSVVRHQHGCLGPLIQTEGCGALPFGAEQPENPEELLEWASRLRFWFEPQVNTPDAYSITNRLVELRGVHVVAGFGYHETICGRFGPPLGSDAKLERVIATSSPDCCERATDWLNSVYGRAGVRITRLDGRATCEDAVRVLVEPAAETQD